MSSSLSPFSVEELWAIPRPGAPSLAPDGSRLVVALTRYDLAKNEAHDEIWVQAVRGRARRRLAEASSGSDPRWSPDGRRIAFIAKRDGDEVPQVYVIDPDGGEARRVTRLATGASNLRWFPDGRHLAFISWAWPDLATPQAQARRMREQEKDPVKAHASEHLSYRYWDHWLTDGRVPRIYIASLGGGQCRDLLGGSAFSLLWFDPSREFFDISPDGREIALSVDFSAEPKWGNDCDIVTVDVASGKWKNLTAGSRRSNTEPSYSPDGRRLAYLSCDYHRSLDDQPRLSIRERKGGATRRLAAEWDRAPSHLRWARDSSALYCLAEDRGHQPLFRVALEDTQPERLTGAGTVTGFDLGSDGRTVVYTHSSMCLPPEVCARSANEAERVLFAPGQRIVERARLGEVRELRVTGAGGEPVQMWVTYPPRFDPARKWPLLHLIHGGPHSAWLDFFHFRWNAQIFAAQGYVVVSVNYHGSSGWGQSFLESDNGCYGEKELADLEAATDFMLAQGCIDPRRLYAAGGSYGGYMVAWLNGHSSRYRAYVCHAGCWDWVSMMATDVYSYFNHELGAFHWDDEQRVMRQSPHHFAGNCATPTLVIHGELDYRVPAAQGLQYYATLKARGVPARLLVFPDENHWILKPRNAQRWTQEFLDWLARFGGSRLKTPGAVAAKAPAAPKRARQAPAPRR
ncbi:MAG: S9 family peptidase [Betaproteobacteria bacterium]|nr:S9 family peptidase [Betaproteobacteria bacterium]